MDKELLTHLERIADGMNGSDDDTALAAESLEALGLDHPKTMTETEVTERYENMLNECHEAVHIGGETFEPADILREMSPQSYQMGFHEYTSGSFIESPSDNERYYDSYDLEELRNNADDVFSDVKDYLLEDMDEDSHEHKLVNASTDFQNLVSVCRSIHQRDEMQTEIASFTASAASTHEPANDERVERRVRRM